MDRHTRRSAFSASISRHLILAGAGVAVLWLTALLAVPAPANASEGTAHETATLLRASTFGSAAEGGPIRRRAPWYEERDRRERRHTPYGFLNLGGGVFDPSDQPGSGFYGVVSVGSEVAKAFDLGVQLSWYHRDSEGEQVIFTYQDPAGNTVERIIETESVDTDLIPLMGIARLRFPFSPQFQPYVGGGLGYEWLFIEGVDDQGIPFENDYGGFGAQLMGGVNVNASESVGLYGEATYNFSTVDAEFFDPTIGTVVKEEVDFDGLALHGGLRFRF